MTQTDLTPIKARLAAASGDPNKLATLQAQTHVRYNAHTDIAALIAEVEALRRTTNWDIHNALAEVDVLRCQVEALREWQAKAVPSLKRERSNSFGGTRLDNELDALIAQAQQAEGVGT